MALARRLAGEEGESLAIGRRLLRDAPGTALDALLPEELREVADAPARPSFRSAATALIDRVRASTPR